MDPKDVTEEQGMPEFSEDDLKEMETLAGIGLDVKSEKAEAETEKPSEETPEEKPKEEEATGEEKPKEETEEEVKPGPSADELLRAENEKLRLQLNELARQTGGRPEKPSEEASTTLPPKEESLAEVAFVTDEEAEAILDDPKKLNKILNKVFQAGREITMREMPTLVRQQALAEMTLQQKVQSFWGRNKDLEPYRDFASMVANQIEIENPDLGFDEVIERTGTVVRERLHLVKPVEEAASAPEGEKKEEVVPAKPALPSSQRGARKPVPAEKLAANNEQQEMEDLATTFGAF